MDGDIEKTQHQKQQIQDELKSAGVSRRALSTVSSLSVSASALPLLWASKLPKHASLPTPR